jgi:hypothetical protein
MARRHRCFSPSSPVPSSSSPELLLPPSVSSSSASLLRCRYVSSPRPLLPVVDRPPTHITSSASRCSGAGRHSSSPPCLATTHRLEPFAREEREYTHFRSREGDPKLSAPASTLRWSPLQCHMAHKSHMREPMWDVLEMVLGVIGSFLTPASLVCPIQTAVSQAGWM